MAEVAAPQRQAPRTKPTMGASMAGHLAGVGGNAALYAVGTYGWGAAATIGGVTAASAAGSAVLKRRRGGSARRAAGRSGAGRLLGARSTRSGSVGSGRRAGGLGIGGGTKSRAGGIMRKLADGKSLSPKRGGGIPGRGSSPARSRNPLSKGRVAGALSKLPGMGRKAGPGTKAAGNKAAGTKARAGGRLPGSRGTRTGILGRRSGASSRSGMGGKRGSAAGSRASGSKTGRFGKLGRIGSKLNPLRRSKGAEGAASRNGSAGRRGTRVTAASKPLTKLQKLRRRIKPTKKPQDRTPTGWEPAPHIPSSLRRKNTGKETPVRINSKPPTPARKPASAPPMPTRGAAGSGRGGSITAAAEQLAGAMAKPGQDIGTLKGMDANLGDLASAMGVLADGLKHAANAQLEAMPDEVAAHERIMQLSKQAQQLAQEGSLIHSDQKRRNALDHERLDNSRKNERGYDWQSNQQ